MNEEITTEEQTLTIQQAIDLAVQHHTAGDLPKAEGIYQQILQAEPNQPVALHLLGVITHQVGKNNIAVELITKAIAIKPDYAEAHSNLGNTLKYLGKHDDAVASYHKAIAIKPDFFDAHYNLGNALKNLGKYDEAVASYNKAIAIRPDYVDAYINLGDALSSLGQLDEAVVSYNKALNIKPDYAEVHYNLGNIFNLLVKRDEAVARYNKAIAIKPDYAEAHDNLGVVLSDLGRLDEAVVSYNKAINIKPDYAEAHNNLGNALKELGQLDEAVASYNKALAIKPDLTEVQVNLGNTLMIQGKVTEALEYITSAIKLNPNDVKANTAYSTCLGTLVPSWHTPMMNDQLRNSAYLEALQSAIKHDSHVLEIGTGSGIISMMAARCKAEAITTCEMSPLIAQTAGEIIKENGFSDLINVVPIKSTSLRIGVDLPRPANILVSEILSSELLGEGVLSSIEDAKHRLLSPDAQIIPHEASVRIALFGGDHIGESIFVGNVNGFDLSKFNKITSKKLFFKAGSFDIEFLSDTEDAFTFNFMGNNHFPPEEKTINMPVLTTGKCYGVMQWIHMKMDDTITFENNPSNNTRVSGWTHVAYIFDTPLDVTTNQVVKISAMHDRTTTWFSLKKVS